MGTCDSHRMIMTMLMPVLLVFALTHQALSNGETLDDKCSGYHYRFDEWDLDYSKPRCAWDSKGSNYTDEIFPVPVYKAGPHQGGDWAAFGCRYWRSLDVLWDGGRLERGKQYVWARCTLDNAHFYGFHAFSAFGFIASRAYNGPSHCYLPVECDPNDPNVGAVASQAVRAAGAQAYKYMEYDEWYDELGFIEGTSR